MCIQIFLVVCCSCSSGRYMIQLYCLAEQAGFYSNAVECSTYTQVS